MMVRRVHTENGSHIEPELDPAWDEMTKLRWLAAVAAHDTGIRIRVHPARARIEESWRTIPDLYCLEIGRTSVSAQRYHQCWLYLTGVQVGARALLGSQAANQGE